jgi:glycosyltransferase involved in cell wall biosynthesis
MPANTRNSLRILHIARAPAGGVLRHIIDLATAQTALGHEVGLICDRTANGSLEEERLSALSDSISLGVTRLDIGRKAGFSDLNALRKVRKALHSFQPDIVHGHGAKGGMLARLGGTGVKSRPSRLYSPHGGSLHYSPQSLEGKIYFTIERALERVTDALVFVSRFEQITYEQKIGTPRCRTALVYNGISEAEFTPVPCDADATDILFVGHMRALKGVDVLLNALAILKQRGKPLTATLIGAGEDKPAFEDQVRRLELSSRVTFLPPCPVREALRRGKIMVVPSRAESMPYIVLETAAAGMPLLASNVGGIPEILGPDFSGLVPPDDPQALANALGSVIDNLASIRQQAAQQALALKNRFSLHAMADTIMKLCIDLRR